jgi:hypothetical protein
MTLLIVTLLKVTIKPCFANKINFKKQNKLNFIEIGRILSSNILERHL